ncbi:MAG TPA: TerB family tellurite resistance protein [Geminicoccaceae bacterium]
MLDRLKNIFAPDDAGAPKREHDFEDRDLAAAALMVEAARLDDRFDAEERERIRSLLRERFHMSDGDADALLAEAERESDRSVEWQGFTRQIKDGFDYAQRIALIEMLWEVAYADGELHDYEASLLRRVTGLLYVSDRDSGEARKRVLDRLGLS